MRCSSHCSRRIETLVPAASCPPTIFPKTSGNSAAKSRVSFLPLLLLSSDVPELVLTRAATESAEFLDPREPFDSTCIKNMMPHVLESRKSWKIKKPQSSLGMKSQHTGILKVTTTTSCTTATLKRPASQRKCLKDGLRRLLPRSSLRLVAPLHSRFSTNLQILECQERVRQDSRVLSIPR